MTQPLSAHELHALALQLQLFGERGGTICPHVLARLGRVLRVTANDMARMARTLDEIVADAQEDEQAKQARIRRNQVIADICAGVTTFRDNPTTGGDHHE